MYDLQDYLVMRFIQIRLRNQRRSRPYNGHIPLEHIKKLRELIQARPSDEVSHPGLM